MKQSAGILLYRIIDTVPEFFLVHPGGPFFARKHEGWWTIPKGELLPHEEPLDAAIREFHEETGYLPTGNFIPLQPVIQKGGKQVMAWLNQGELDAAAIVSNTFEVEWPPKSGKRTSFPEVDKAGWFTYDDAKVLINNRQAALIDEAMTLPDVQSVL
jgi:predicted NUDIX family NTP pyrophosphohydrolase